MFSNRNNPDQGSIPTPSRMDPGLAALLRKAADGELASEEMVALRMYMDANGMAEDRVEFERQLRSACRQSMANVTAPAGLRERIEAMIRDAQLMDNHDRRAGRVTTTPVVVRRVEMGAVERGPYRMVDWLWSTRSAVAAVALLVAGFLSAKVLDSSARIVVPTISDGAEQVVRADMVGYLSSQFAASAGTPPDAMAAKVQFMSLQRTLGVAQDWLKQSPVTPASDAVGISFAGGMQATMPGPGKAFHFRYRVNRLDVPGQSQLVSVFVQQDHLELPLRQGVTYGIIAPVDTVTWVSRRDGLVYYILGESRWAVRRLISSLGIPEASEAIKASPDVDP